MAHNYFSFDLKVQSCPQGLSYFTLLSRFLSLLHLLKNQLFISHFGLVASVRLQHCPLVAPVVTWSLSLTLYTFSSHTYFFFSYLLFVFEPGELLQSRLQREVLLYRMLKQTYAQKFCVFLGASPFKVFLSIVFEDSKAFVCCCFGYSLSSCSGQKDLQKELTVVQMRQRDVAVMQMVLKKTPKPRQKRGEKVRECSWYVQFCAKREQITLQASTFFLSVCE